LHEAELPAVIVWVLDSVITGGHVGEALAVADGVGVGGGAPQLDSVSVVFTVVVPSYPPAAKRVFPMAVPPTNERATFSDGPVDHVSEAGS